MPILGKKQNVEEVGVTPIIKELEENVLVNRIRVVEQRTAILQKIEELKKELAAPARIKSTTIDSFSIEDIEASATPKVTRSEIARKIAALTNASELTIYSDNGFMDSIYEYLTAVRPVVEQIDRKQWELISLRNQIEKEYKERMDAMWASYNELDQELKELLEVADVNYPRPYGYNKHVTPGATWANEVNDVTHLVDTLLNAKNRDIYAIIKN